MDTFVSPGAKRQFGENGANGREKRLAVGGNAVETVFRILCPGSRTGSVIGKGGSIIKTLREETHARIKVADAVPGVEERVVIVSGLENPDQDWTPAQEGLLRVHARITDVPPEDNDSPLGGSITTRLLVPSTQIGCLLGKGGSIISQMRKDTGAQIRILPKDQLPGCALPTDELVQIIGELPSVVKALESISTQLRANPPRDKPAAALQPPQLFSPTMPSHLLSPAPLQQQTMGTVYQTMPVGGMQSPGPSWQQQQQQQQQQMGGGLPSYMHQLNMQTYPNSPPQVALHGGHMAGVGASQPIEVVFRVLCPMPKIGSIIGKGGSIIKQMRDETLARIKIADAVEGVEERVVIVSGNEVLGAPVSPAQEAIFRIHAQMVEPEAQDPAAVITTRMLVPSGQIGCLLGRGGSIIAEMRRTSRANIRILPKDQLPGCALETDELLQLMGDLQAVRSALHQVTNRLRASPPKDAPASGAAQPVQPQEHILIAAPAGSFPQTGAPNGVPMELMAGGPPPAGLGGAPNPMSPPGGVRPSTLTVPVPIVAVGSIIGKGGSNIAQIRNISGARVKLHDQQEGATERVVEITGTADQLQAAQSLLQAFIISGTVANQGAAF